MEIFIVTYYSDVQGVFNSEEDADEYIMNSCEEDDEGDDEGYHIEMWLVGTGL